MLGTGLLFFYRCT